MFRPLLWNAMTFGDARPSMVGVLVAGFVCAFAFWQFQLQRDRVKRPDAYFRNDDKRAFAFHKRQASRRLQLAALAGLSGLSMLVGLYLPGASYPFAFGLAWLLALVFIVWASALAIVDLISIRFFFSADFDKNRAEKILLDYKMKKFQEESLREAQRVKDAADESEETSDDDAHDERLNTRA